MEAIFVSSERKGPFRWTRNKNLSHWESVAWATAVQSFCHGDERNFLAFKHYHEKSFATNIQTSLGSNPGGKEELINNFQMKIGQDMDLGMYEK